MWSAGVWAWTPVNIWWSLITVLQNLGAQYKIIHLRRPVCRKLEWWSTGARSRAKRGAPLSPWVSEPTRIEGSLNNTEAKTQGLLGFPSRVFGHRLRNHWEDNTFLKRYHFWTRSYMQDGHWRSVCKSIMAHAPSDLLGIHSNQLKVLLKIILVVMEPQHIEQITGGLICGKKGSEGRPAWTSRSKSFFSTNEWVHVTRSIPLQSQLPLMVLPRAGVPSLAKELPGKFLKGKHSVLLTVEKSIDLVVWHAVGKANICY